MQLLKVNCHTDQAIALNRIWHLIGAAHVIASCTFMEWPSTPSIGRTAVQNTVMTQQSLPTEFRMPARTRELMVSRSLQADDFSLVSPNQYHGATQLLTRCRSYCRCI